MPKRYQRLSLHILSKISLLLFSNFICFEKIIFTWKKSRQFQITYSESKPFYPSSQFLYPVAAFAGVLVMGILCFLTVIRLNNTHFGMYYPYYAASCDKILQIVPSQPIELHHSFGQLHIVLNRNSILYLISLF